MKKIIIAAIVIVIIIGAGVAITAAKNKKSPVSTSNCSTDSVITYTAEREFSPTCIRIKSGTTVTYQNQSSKTLEVGADPHPIHNGNKEVSNGQFTLDVEPGKAASTKMTKTGTFGIHDHEHASARAIIIVE